MDKPFLYVPEDRLLIIVGNFGSGKTEVSVNLALKLAESFPVEIVDLDIQGSISLGGKACLMTEIWELSLPETFDDRWARGTLGLPE